MQDYLVYRVEECSSIDSLLIIPAESEGAAIRTYGQIVGIHDGIFRSHLYDQSTNMSFAERFFYDEHYPLASEEKGRWFYDEAETRQRFEEKAEAFFADRPQFAELYTRSWWDRECSGWEELEQKWAFPDEMRLLMWYDGFHEGVVAVPIADIERVSQPRET